MATRRSLLLTFLVATMLLLPAACGSEEAEPESAGEPAMSMDEREMADDGEAAAADEREMEMGSDAAAGGMQMAGTAAGEGGPVSSGKGLFTVRYAAETDPIMVNTMHSWVINLSTPEGEPIEKAQITVAGDMPAHGHGLPTQPEVTEELGGGDYRIEGLKFQMGGYWEIYLDVVTAEGEADSVIIPLQFN